MFRTCETRPGPGALYTPGTAVPHGHVCIPRPPPAALQRPVPVTPVSRPVPGCLSHEASARVHWRSPLPAIPLACGSQTERDPSGFPPGFTPGRAGLGRACRGGDRPQALTWNNAVAISDLLRRIHSQRATSRRNALARCPLHLERGSVSNSHHPSSEGTFRVDTPARTPIYTVDRGLGDPTFVLVIRIERDLGVPLISLNALTGHRPASRRLHRPFHYAGAGCGAGFRRLSGGRYFASSGDWDSGSLAFAISRGSRSAPPHTPEHGRCFPSMLLSPSPFRSR